jgi:hypothetical protein
VTYNGQQCQHITARDSVIDQPGSFFTGLVNLYPVNLYIKNLLRHSCQTWVNIQVRRRESLSNGIKASFILGAIGGFLIALVYSWNLAMDFIPWNQTQHYQILILGLIPISIGFLGLWRKSGNVIPLVSAICIIVWDIIVPLPYYLSGLTSTVPELVLIGWIFISVGWITAGISAWLLRDEFSPVSIVAALVFLACGAVSWPLALIGGGWNIWVSLLWAATGIVTVIYFLDAART